jgi:hypothetical protein
VSTEIRFHLSSDGEATVLTVEQDGVTFAVDTSRPMVVRLGPGWGISVPVLVPRAETPQAPRRAYLAPMRGLDERSLASALAAWREVDGFVNVVGVNRAGLLLLGEMARWEEAPAHA